MELPYPVEAAARTDGTVAALYPQRAGRLRAAASMSNRTNAVNAQGVEGQGGE